MTGGQVSTTEIAGLTLGGVVGWLMRTCGLVVDNLLSADLVTADGRLLTASPTEPPDLFWGLQGGGGNFGVVTSFEYRLHPVGPMVLGGLALYPADQARDLLCAYRDFMATAPDELQVMAVFLSAPPAPFVPPEFHGAPMVALAACYAGPVEDGQEVLAPLLVAHPPAMNLLGPMPYVAVQRLFDAGVPFGQQAYLKSDHLRELSDAAIDTILTHLPDRTSPLSVFVINRLEARSAASVSWTPPSGIGMRRTTTTYTRCGPTRRRPTGTSRGPATCGRCCARSRTGCTSVSWAARARIGSATPIHRRRTRGWSP